MKSPIFPPLVLVLGLLLLMRGLEWWNHELAVKSNPQPPPYVAPTLPTPTPMPTPEVAKAEELAALASTDSRVQAEVLETLARRRIDERWIAAVRAAHPANKFLATKLDCLKTRLPGHAGIARAIAALPTQDEALWPAQSEQTDCYLNVLADRIEESPDEIVEALIPMRLSFIARITEPASRGLRKVKLKAAPPSLRAALQNAAIDLRKPGLVLDLEMERIDPAFVDELLGDERLAVSVRTNLVNRQTPEAARYIARKMVESADESWNATGRQRDRELGDLSGILAEFACDPSHPPSTRIRSLEYLGAWGHSGALPVLGAEKNWPPELKAYVDAAVAAIRSRPVRKA